MKKHILIITLILSASLIFSAVTLNNAKATSKNVKSSETQEKIYILKDYNGRIALFEEGKSIPLEVYDIFTKSLPEADSEIIKDGLTVNQADIQKLLEEYLS